MHLSELLNEKLKPSQYREYLGTWDKLAKTLYKDIFEKYRADWQTKPEVYRIYIPFERKHIKEPTIPNDIDTYLSQKEVKVVDYTQGIGKDKHNRDIRIGKVLADNPELKKKFDNDPERAATKQKKYYAVISRHPYDIAGMSTDRGWSSCMNLEGGSNIEAVKKDIIYKSLIAYCIREDDKNIQNPLARLLIRAYRDNKGNVKFKEASNIYGTETQEFRETVENWIEEVNPKISGFFKAHPSLYYDTEDEKSFGTFVTEEDWNEFIKDPDYEELIEFINNNFIQYEVPYRAVDNDTKYEIITYQDIEGVGKEEFIYKCDYLDDLIKNAFHYDYLSEFIEEIKNRSNIDEDEIQNILKERNIDEDEYEQVIYEAIRLQHNEDIYFYSQLEAIIGYEEGYSNDDTGEEYTNVLMVDVPFNLVLEASFKDIHTLYFWHSIVEEQKEKTNQEALEYIEDYIKDFRFDAETYIPQAIIDLGLE